MDTVSPFNLYPSFASAKMAFEQVNSSLSRALDTWDIGVQANSIRTLTIVFLVAIWIAILCRPSEKFEKFQPPLVPSWIPWLGHGLQYIRSPSNFLKIHSRQYGSVYKFLAGGKYLVVISNPTTITNFLRDRSNTIDVLNFQSMHLIAGIKDASRMPYIYPLIQGPVLSHAASGLSQRHLSNLAFLLNQKLFSLLSSVTSDSEVTVGVAELVRRNIYIAASYAMLGPHYPSEETYEDFILFDENVKDVIQKPSFLPKLAAEKARDRIAAKLLDFVHRYWREEDGGYLLGAEDSYMTNVIREMKASNLNEEEVSRLQNVWLWGAHSNLIQVAVWLLYYLITDRNMLSKIREEIHHSLDGNFSGIESLLEADPRALDNPQFPLLNSAIKETMRMVLLPSSVRVATADTQIKDERGQPIHIRKGEVILADVRSMHLNEEFYEDANTFKFDRFARWKGINSPEKKHLIPFGAGSHFCIGRYHAEHALRVFIILLLHIYDISPGPNSSSVPPADPESLVSLLRSKGDLMITLRPHNPYL